MVKKIKTWVLAVIALVLLFLIGKFLLFMYTLIGTSFADQKEKDLLESQVCAGVDFSLANVMCDKISEDEFGLTLNIVNKGINLDEAYVGYNHRGDSSGDIVDFIDANFTVDSGKTVSFGPFSIIRESGTENEYLKATAGIYLPSAGRIVVCSKRSSIVLMNCNE